DEKIGDGSASLQLWQSGLVPPRRSTTRSHGLAISVKRAPGHLTVALASKPGALKSLQILPQLDGRDVRASLVETPPPPHHVTTPPAVTTPQPTPQPTPTPTPTPTHTTTTTTPTVTIG